MEIPVLISEKEIALAVSRIANHINVDYVDKEVIFICVLKGSYMFFSDLTKEITLPISIEFLTAKSYKGFESTGTVDLDFSGEVEGKHVVVVDDIVDTGYTVSKIIAHLTSLGATDIKVCALLDKPSSRKVRARTDYVGFDVEDFVVGYGLDYDQKYRNLPYIGYLTK